MNRTSAIADHYTRGDLLTRLTDALSDDGADPAHPTIEALAPYDHFHGRGLEATVEFADKLEIAAADRLLDIGSGIGGPARYMAGRFGCHVTGIDLTAEFCDLAHHLTKQMSLEDKVAIEQGNALAMPFDDGQFDGAYSMNVSMNIEDKMAFYNEISRVLRPGAWLALSEVAKGSGDGVAYPTPWARTAETSFLQTLEETREGLEASGFTVVSTRDTKKESLAFGAKSRAMVERGEKPPHRAIQLIHGDLAKDAAANMTRALAEGGTLPIEILCRKPVAG